MHVSYIYIKKPSCIWFSLHAELRLSDSDTVLFFLHRWSSSTSNEGPAEKKTRARSSGGEVSPQTPVLLFDAPSLLMEFLFSSETDCNAEHRDGPRNRDLEEKAGRGQTNRGAQKVSFTQT